MSKLQKSPIDKILAPVVQFIHLEHTAGIFLFLSVLIAIIWANSSYSEAYHHLWEHKFTLGFNAFSLNQPLHIWINDGLMAIFFFVIGLELKREFMEGELSTLKKASLPMAAALGGMLAPALIFYGINKGTPAQSGWGIPMATDIAFALALVALAGKQVPLSVKIFLSALAVADDLGAILVIAFFYSSQLNFLPLCIAAGLILILIVGNRLGFKHHAFYLLIGIGVWVGFFLSGIHATIAGVLVAFTIPSATTLETKLHPWVAFLIMPLFALANAGMLIGADFFTTLINPVSLGVIIGLIAGKFCGILLFTWLMVSTGLAKLPTGANWRHITGIALLAGVGFTMSLFISNLAFDRPEFIDEAKYGILTASVIAGILGLSVLKYF
jgi:NhaA family Na+:H+ antiporter